MTIILYSPTDGYAQYDQFAVIEDGAVIDGEFVPPPTIDLSDEEALLARYNGPGVVAARPESDASTATYECSMCGARVNADSEDDERRWMPCPECETDRFFDRMQQGGT